MDIDWSKAPEGAEFWNPHSELFYRSADGEFQKFSETRGRWTLASGDRYEYQTLIAKPAPWNGEGLPPAGTVCEVDGSAGETGFATCTINYSSKDVIVWRYLGSDVEHYACAGAREFRKIRTPEQIAAEEREKYLQEVGELFELGNPYDSRTIGERMYDAGYRKFEIVDDKEEATHCFGLPISEIQKMAEG